MNFIKGSRASWTYDLEPVFLVGAPRSGTTWLQAMLASHPLICSGVETHFFATFAHAAQEISTPWDKGAKVGLSEYIQEKDFYSVMRELFWHCISSLPQPPNNPKLFLEKTGTHSLHAPFILKVFPNARFIHLIRDARSVSSSILRASTSWGKNWAPNDLDKAVNLWLKFVKSGRNITEIVSPDQYIEVKYEELRYSLHSQLMRLFEWLKVEADGKLITKIAEATSLENMRKSKNMFSSILSPRQIKKAAPRFPSDFIGPAAYKDEEWGLTYLQLLRVEHLAGDLLDELAYKRNQLSLFEKLIVRIPGSRRISRRFRRLRGLPKN